MTVKKSQLHALLAVEGSLTNTAKAILDETINTFAKKPDHFRGHVKTVTYFDEKRAQENERDEKAITTTVDEKLSYAFNSVAGLFDALLQKEEANQRAEGELVVDGKSLGTFPATFLLGLETRLKAIQQVILAAPTLDPSLIWDKDEGSGSGRYRSRPQTSKRTEKTVQHKVLTAATDKHPAQIEKWNEDTPVAAIETTHMSGMWTPARKSEVLDRLERLLAEVKRTRQMANTVEVKDLHVGKTLLNFILG